MSRYARESPLPAGRRPSPPVERTPPHRHTGNREAGTSWLVAEPLVTSDRRTPPTADPPCRCWPPARPGMPAGGNDYDGTLAQAVHLYQCHRWSTYRIAEVVGLPRQRLARLLRTAGVALRRRGAGGQRPQRPENDPPDLPDLLAKLYLDQRLSTREVGLVLGMPDRTVRDRLAEYGTPRRTRGRLNREDRRVLPRVVLDDWYDAGGLSAAEVAALSGTSRGIVLRNAHDQGVPVRVGGPPPAAGPTEITLIDALYADPLVAAVLRRHHVPLVPAGAPLWRRFPDPIPLHPDLVRGLYTEAGVSTTHIELLTGHPAITVTRLLHTLRVPMRTPGGRSPFLRRWRAAHRHRPPAADRSVQIGARTT
jgi:hypothetical protein